MMDNLAGIVLAIGAIGAALVGGLVLKRGQSGAVRGIDEPLVRLPIKQYRRILVPTGVGMCHDDFVQEAASLACHLSRKKGSRATEIVFTYVIPVPRVLPLNAPMPAEEAEAEQVLNAAATLARERGITHIVTQLRKGRTVEDETVKAVEQESADLVILTPQSHAAAQVGMPLDRNRAMIAVPATQAAVRAIPRETPSTSRCVAELDTVETSDGSETVTGRLLRRLPCEAMVARRASMTASQLPVEFSRN